MMHRRDRSVGRDHPVFPPEAREAAPPDAVGPACDQGYECR